MTYDMRFVVYAPDGARRGVLHRVQRAEAALTLNEVSALRLWVPTDFPEAGYLSNAAEVAVEVSSGGSWIEPPNARFLRLQWELNPADNHPVLSVPAPGYAWLLSRAGIEGAQKPWFRDEDDKRGSYDRRFLTATPGQIMATAISEAKGAGSLPGMTTDFTATHDSDGKPWASTITEITYTPGLALLDILDDLVGLGLVDWQMEGRKLRIFNQDTYLARDRTTDPNNPIVLRLGQDITDAPTRGDLSNLVHRAILRGDEGKVWSREATGLSAPWGKFQSVTNQASVTESGTAQTILTSVLRQSSGELVEMTRAIRFESARHLPLIDYQVGEYLLAPNVAGEREKTRVCQVTLSKDPQGRTSGSLVLNDRFTESAVRTARRLRSIQGGATLRGGVGGTHGGALPPGRPEDVRAPAAPSTASAYSTAYVEPSGRVRAIAHVGWASVNTADDGDLMAVSGYQVWVRNPLLGTNFVHVATVDGTSYDYGPTDPGLNITFRIHAVAQRNGRVGAYRQTFTITASDDIPPNVPSEFTDGGSRLGTIIAHWDGLDEDGNPMPGDFDYLEVAVGDASNTTETYELLRNEGNVIIPGRPYGVPTFVRARAWDTSGNVSDWNEAWSSTPVRLTESDYLGSPIYNEMVSQRDQINTISSDVAEAKARADQAYAEAQAALAGGNNLFPNPSFRDGIDGWTSTGSLTPFNVTDGGVNDDHYATATQQFLSTEKLPVSDGYAAFRMEGYFRVDSPRTGEIHAVARVRRSDNSILTTSVPILDGAEMTPGQWVHATAVLEIEDEEAVETELGFNVGGTVTKVDDLRANDFTLMALTRREVDTLAQNLDTLSVQTQAELLGKTRIVTTSTAPTENRSQVLWLPPGGSAQVWDSATSSWVPLRSAGSPQVHHRTTPPGSTVGTMVGETWFMHSTLGANGRLLGMWQWDGTAWRAKTVDETFLPKVHIGEGTYGTLSGVRLEAGTVSADALAVGLNNMVSDPTFGNAAMRDKRAIVPNTSFITDTVLPSSHYAMACGAAVTTSGYASFGVEIDSGGYGSWTPLQGGERVALSVHARRVGAGSNTFQFYVWRQYKNSAGTLFSERVQAFPTAFSPSTAGSWHEAVWEAPENTVAVQFGVRYSTAAGGAIHFEQPFWCVQSRGVVIRDGAVTGDKIGANEITGDHVRAGSIDTPHLRADAVSATQLDADAITAKHRITGALIQTSATANRGVKVRSDGISAYNGVGTRKVYINAASGDIEGEGVFRARREGSPVSVEVTPAAYGDRPGVRFGHGQTAQLQPVIYSVGPGTDDYPNRALVIHGSEATINSSGRAELVLEHGGNFKLAKAYGTGNGTGIHVSGRTLDIQGQHRGTANAHVAQQLSGQVGPAAIAGGARLGWTVNYGAPTPVNARGVVATGRIEGSGTTFHTAEVSVNSVTASGFRCVARPHEDSGGQWRIDYLATWR